MKRFLLFFTLLVFAFTARAQNTPYDTCVRVFGNCMDTIDVFKIYSPQPFNPHDTMYHVYKASGCNGDYWKNGQVGSQPCTNDTLRSKAGSSCNTFLPGVNCIMQDSSLNRLVLYSYPKDLVKLIMIRIKYALVTKSTMSNPYDKPNLPRQLVVRVEDNNGNLIKRMYVDLPTTSKNDSIFDIFFPLDVTLDYLSNYRIFIFGRDPIYGYQIGSKPYNPPVWEFFEIETVYDCGGLNALCQWGNPEKIDSSFDGCTKNSWYIWHSTCNVPLVAKFSLTDTVKPKILNCPSDVTIKIPNGECETDYDLPRLSVEECLPDEVFVYAVNNVYGILQSGDALYNVKWQIGKSETTYTAYDACGNSATCKYNVTVQGGGKNINLACHVNTVVSLNDSCVAIPASKFVQAVTDLCCSTYTTIGARMDDGKWGRNIKFCCNDVGKEVMVMLTVFSDCDSTINASCMVRVTVQDKYVPRITCPADITVDCSVFDPNKIDTPKILENCLSSYRRIDSVSIDGLCKTGQTFRTWTAVDYSGNSATCTQTITIVNAKAFSDANIIWPRDTVLFECKGKYDPSRTGSPKFTFPGCSRGAASSFKDEVFGDFHKGGICKKILRTWKVLDWCNYPGPTWSHVQVIALMDSIKPIITFCPKDTSLSNFGACDSKVFLDLDDVSATDCSGILSITNDSRYAFANGANASGNYPNGSRKITFTVTDSCGSTSTCAFTITVSDKKPPAPFCIDIITDLQYMPTMGVVQQVNVRKLVLKAEENCPNCSVTFSYDSLKVDTVKWFNCNNIGENEVCVWFTDCKGNQSKCCPKIIIQDNNDLCPHNLTITGALSTLKNLPVKQVDVELNGKAYPFDDKFTFVQLKPGMKCKIKPLRNNEFLDGVTTADIVKIQRYVLGKENFTPYQLIAADVNNSGSITTSDVSELRKLILGVIQGFTNNTSWKFLPSDYVFPDPSNPFIFPDFRTYTIYQSELKADFIGLKIGDVNNSTTGNIVGGNLSGRSREDVNFEDFFKLKVSPNPAKDKIEISCPFYEYSIKPTIVITKADGSTVFSGEYKEKMTLDISQLVSGMYFVKVSSEDSFDFEKFLKN